MAGNTRPSTTDTASLPTIADGTQQAAAAFEQDALDASLAAAQDQAAADAARNAAATRKAAEAKAAAAAKSARVAEAAKQRAAAARAAEQAKLNASQVAAVAASSSGPSSDGSSGSDGSAGSSSSAPAAPALTVPAPVAPPSAGKVDQLIAFLKSQVGKPYVYGASGPSSYDCSGLTQAAFASVGINLPRTSQSQSTFGTPVSLGSLQPGDLVFWGGQGSAYHVGVFIGNGQYLDAANPSTPVGIHQMADYMPDWAVAAL
jgi:cell wall-associated NlpC family hydrolase